MKIKKNYMSKFDKIEKVNISKKQKIKYIATSIIVILFFATLIISYSTMILTLQSEISQLETYHLNKSNKMIA